MLVTVTHVSNTEKCIIVIFSTVYGDACGRWVGEEPIVGHGYYVELETSETLQWGKDIKITSHDDFLIEKNKNSNGIRIVGRLEMFRNGGLAVIRFSDITIDVSTTGKQVPLGSYIEIQIQDLTLYQYDI